MSEAVPVRRRPPRVLDGLTHQLLWESLPLLTDQARALAATTRIFVVDSKVGRAGHRYGVAQVTVPGWVFKKSVHYCSRMKVAGGTRFAAYYLAHELAHIRSRSRKHGSEFMEAFKAFCPAELQFYEYAYKPRNAERAGVLAAAA